MKNYGTQKQMVLNHLKMEGSITSWQAITEYSITRLSEYIRSLRHENMVKINSIKEKNETRRWVRYELVK